MGAKDQTAFLLVANLFDSASVQKVLIGSSLE